MKHAIAVLCIALFAVPCHASSGFASGPAGTPLRAQAHLDFRIVVHPSMALQMTPSATRVTSNQDLQLQWQAGVPVSPTRLRAGRSGVDQVIVVQPPAAGMAAGTPASPGRPGVMTLASP